MSFGNWARNRASLAVAMFALPFGFAVLAKGAPQLLSAMEIAQFKSLAAIGFDAGDDRLPGRQAEIVRASTLFNAGKWEQSLGALDRVDAVAPFEVSDFASWPLRDIISCRKTTKALKSQNRSQCAFAFESGSATCARTRGMNRDCADYYCGYELLRPAYEKPHESYLTGNQTRTFQSVIKTVDRICRQSAVSRDKGG